MASKYLIQFRGRHVFNPSNLALVLAFLILGSSRVEPLQFWWGPMSPGARGRAARDRRGRVRRSSRGSACSRSRVLFWITFASALGILALSGHAFSANWHLGPVADGYFWKVLITSPEVFIFLSFMITDPQHGARDAARPADLRGRDRPARRAADRADADRVLGEGRAARHADDRLRRAAAHHPRARGARAPPGADAAVRAAAAPPAGARPSRRSAPRLRRRCSSSPAAPRARSPRSPAARSTATFRADRASTPGVVSITPQTGRPDRGRRDRRPAARRRTR